ERVGFLLDLLAVACHACQHQGEPDTPRDRRDTMTCIHAAYLPPAGTRSRRELADEHLRTGSNAPGVGGDSHDAIVPTAASLLRVRVATPWQIPSRREPSPRPSRSRRRHTRT